MLTEVATVLLECRQRGMPFGLAWRRAVKCVRIDRDMELSRRTEMAQWRIALEFAKREYELAYDNKPSEMKPIAVPTLREGAGL